MNSILKKYGILCLCLVYSVIISASHIDYNSPYHDEALNILMGNQVLALEACPDCPQNTGSVLVQPVLVALGDRVGGITGARGVGIIFALGLTVAVFFIARRLFSHAHANTAVILLVISSTYVYLSMLATYDIIAAFFLATSFWFLLISKDATYPKAYFFIAISSALLFMASITKYAVTVFVLSFLFYFATSYRNKKIFIVFLMVLVLLTTTYYFFAIFPIRDALESSVGGVYSESHIPATVIIDWALRWLTIPGVIVAFALYKGEFRRQIVVLAIMSAPLILLHLISGAAQSINKNIIFSFIFLIPATAVGLHCMSIIFSGDSGKGITRYFFAGMLMVVLWAFGIQDLRWLERQYPDLSEVTRYFDKYGYKGMRVVIDSDFGNAAYAYSLQGKHPGAIYQSIREYEKYRELRGTAVPLPDYIILDDYHQKKLLRNQALKYIKSGNYALQRRYVLKMSWGEKNVDLYRRIL